MPTCTCGKTVDDWRGARGHVQFTDDEQHGGDDVPDDWRQLFDEDDEADEQPEADEDEQEPAADGATDEEVAEAVEATESDSGQSEASESKGRIRQVLTTPLDELLGL